MNVTLNCNSCCEQQQLVNVALFQGETLSLVVKFPFDVTDYVFTSTISFPTPLELTNGDGIEIIDSENGEITLNLTSEQTQDTAPGQYPFDFWSSAPGSPTFNTEEFSGFINIFPSITQIT
jgi:hypothetical protein